MSLSAFDVAVAELMQLGYARETAEREVQAQRLAPQGEQPDRTRILEKREQHECWKIYRAHGCVVYTLSQSRATKQTPGLPDLYVFAPQVRRAWWHECKRSVGGRVSPAQEDFMRLAEECGVLYVLGDRSHAWAILQQLGVVAA